MLLEEVEFAWWRAQWARGLYRRSVVPDHPLGRCDGGHGKLPGRDTRVARRDNVSPPAFGGGRPCSGAIGGIGLPLKQLPLLASVARKVGQRRFGDSRFTQHCHPRRGSMAVATRGPTADGGSQRKHLTSPIAAPGDLAAPIAAGTLPGKADLSAGETMLYDVPPQPNYSEVRKAEAAVQNAADQLARAKEAQLRREREQRERALIAEQRRKMSETQQRR